MRSNLRLKAMGLFSALALAAVPGLFVASPASAAVGGTVTCDAYSSSYPVVGIWIDSSNNAHDGFASWSPISGQPWKATFNKGDVNESYTVHVGCGGTRSNWNQTAYSTPTTGDQDFICHVSGTITQRICSS